MIEKIEKKEVILLTLIDDWEKLCKKSLSKRGVKKDSYSLGYISGELKTIEIMKQFIEETRKR